MDNMVEPDVIEPVDEPPPLTPPPRKVNSTSRKINSPPPQLSLSQEPQRHGNYVTRSGRVVKPAQRLTY